MIDPIALRIPLLGNTISIHWYGVIIAVGLLLAILLASYHAKREGHNPDIILDMALIVVPLAVLGARLYYVAFAWDFYSGGPLWKIFAVWEGGLAIYGAVIGGLIGVFIYTRFNRKIRFMELLDILSPSLILGQAIGRWGNFVNQEAYGTVINDPSWQWFPAAVFIQNDLQFHMATFFYESMWNFIVFIVLVVYFKAAKKRVNGNVFWLYLLLYGIGRVVIEGLRTDSLMLGTLRISQILSGVLIVAALAMLIANAIRRRKREEVTVELDDSLRLTPEMASAEGETGADTANTTDEALEPADEAKAEQPPVEPK